MVQGKKRCKQQENFWDWTAFHAFHLSFNLHFIYFILITCVSPALLIIWILNFWMETFRNRGWVGVCPLQIQKLMLSDWTYHWNWTYWTPACIYLFQHCPRQNPSSNNKELHGTTLLSTSIHPQNVCPYVIVLWLLSFWKLAKREENTASLTENS